MGQIADGLRSVLSCPNLYGGLQHLVGTKAGRQKPVSRCIRPAEGSRSFDAGCGTAKFLSLLPTRVKHFGCGSSPGDVVAAKCHSGVRDDFRCDRIEGERLGLLPQSDIVLGIGVLHHLDDASARNVFEVAREALSREGRFVAIGSCLAVDQNPLARLLIRFDRGQSLGSAQGNEAVAREIFPKVKGTVRHRRMIPYTHWIMECPTC